MSAGAVPTVSVVVPVHDGGEAFRRCIRALAAADPPPLELIVADDGSTDGSAETAARAGGQVRVVRTAGRRGPAAARNRGALAARGEVVLFIDADVEAPSSLCGRVAAAFAADPGLAAVFGAYDDAPAAGGLVTQYRNLLHCYTHRTSRERAWTFFAGCGAVRRDVLHRVGGFDERYDRPSIEDIELGYRLAEAGLRVRLDPTLEVKHLKRWTVRSMLATDLFRRGLPWMRLILARGRAESDLNLRVSSRIAVALGAAAVALLLAAPVAPGAAPIALACIAAQIAIDAPLLDFFRRRRGVLFALGTIPWHRVHYLVCAVAVAAAVAGHGAARLAGAVRAEPVRSEA